MTHPGTAAIEKAWEETPSTPLRAALTRGMLEVSVDRCDVAPGSLFGFAERRNPKRAFLFVSRVLGRHIPTRPYAMRASFEALAAKIPSDLPGPVLVIGMAETAVGLGAGVHRALSATRDDAVYLVSTRHPVGGEVFARFEEEHSHASAHLIHLPADPLARQLMLNARSLVLVDDEASTGKTFINLLRALTDAGLKHVERVVTVTLTDWSRGAVRQALGEKATAVSLLEGSYRFIEDASAPLPEMPPVGCVAQGDWPIDPRNDWGRLGAREHLDTLAPALTVAPGERVLVVGTGEFVWRPFLLAERLGQAGADVHFSSTTRSPISLGHVIRDALSFSDNYGLGIQNFLYNVSPGQFDRVLICTETAAEAVDASLVEALAAEVITDVR
jgi:adenine/guanine phosphoribosyltransferase-like PRPP-binding protein